MPRPPAEPGPNQPPRPGALRLFRAGILAERWRQLALHLEHCELCPRRCGVDRIRGEPGFCRTGARAKIASITIHPWEEPLIAGTGGSGAIFFSGCSLQCVFCQNYPISQLGVGRERAASELAQGMLRLQRKGAHNLNLVTATHQLPAFLEALVLAIPMGFSLPVVYNCSGYERVEILRLLDGIVDIYLPDIKYGDQAAARFCSRAGDYVEVNRAALKEMWRQVGPLQTGHDGVAVRGLLVRHLVLPGRLAATRDCLAFLKEELGPEVWVSLMNQYFPAHRAFDKPPLNRKVTEAEYQEALQALFDLDLTNGFVQEACSESFDS